MTAACQGQLSTRIYLRSRKVLTRSQKRERKKEHSEHGPTWAQEYQKWEFGPEEIQRLQREDKTLKDIRDVAADAVLEKEAEFFHRDSTYYRNRKLKGEMVEQLVLPEACRGPVLHMAHAIPMAGHLGRKKTTERVLQRFFWLGVSKDVAEYCKNCPSCQKASSKRVAPAPLIPLPVIAEPFSRIALYWRYCWASSKEQVWESLCTGDLRLCNPVPGGHSPSLS